MIYDIYLFLENISKSVELKISISWQTTYQTLMFFMASGAVEKVTKI